VPASVVIGYIPVPDRSAAAFGCANRRSCRLVDVDAENAFQPLRPTHRGVAWRSTGLFSCPCAALKGPMVKPFESFQPEKPQS